MERIQVLRDELSEEAERYSDQGRNMSDALPAFESRLLNVAERLGRRKDMVMAIARSDYGKVMTILGELEEEQRDRVA